MPPDVRLRIGARAVQQFLRYRIDADLYQAADSFDVDFYSPGFEIEEGAYCELSIDGVKVLAGVIDKIIDGGGAEGNKVRIEGRDLMGQVVDAHVETFTAATDATLKDLADQLLANIPYLNRKNIVYQAGLAGAAAQQTAASNPLLDDPQKKALMSPGDTVFDVLKTYAVSRGAMFFALPDGTFVFGRPKAAGKPAFNLTRKKNGQGNNVTSGTRTRDISQRYSKITIVGQQQGSDVLAASEINTSATETDSDVPIYRPYVAENNNDGQSPAKHAKFLKDKQRSQGFSLTYKTARHSQNGKPWTINELCSVEDEVLGLRSVYLISGRTFELDAEAGPSTEIRLSLPGALG